MKILVIIMQNNRFTLTPERQNRIDELLTMSGQSNTSQRSLDFNKEDVGKTNPAMALFNPGETFIEPGLKKLGVPGGLAFGIGLGTDIIAPGPGEITTPIKSIKGTFKGLKGLSTKLLEKFRGMSDNITEQEFNTVLNRTRKEGLKQADEQIVQSSLVKENGMINLSKTANKVEEQLVPLTPTQVKSPRWSNVGQDFIGDGKYGEIVYQSPIKTSAGDVHFGYGYESYEEDTSEYIGRGVKESFPNYFSHVRYEDMADGKTRKILEHQSDLMQKGRLDLEMKATQTTDLYGHNIQA